MKTTKEQRDAFRKAAWALPVDDPARVVTNGVLDDLDEALARAEKADEAIAESRALFAKVSALRAEVARKDAALFDITNLKYCEADPVDRMFDVAKMLARAALAVKPGK